MAGSRTQTQAMERGRQWGRRWRRTGLSGRHSSWLIGFGRGGPRRMGMVRMAGRAGGAKGAKKERMGGGEVGERIERGEKGEAWWRC